MAIRHLVFVLAFAWLVHADPLLVQTKNGAIQGKYGGYGSRAFFGIPYAAAPIGELRWRVPSQKGKWSGTLDATKTKPICPQTNANQPMDEDCLYLNIWLPNEVVSNSSIMLWLHPGGFQAQSGSNPLFNGSYIATQTENIVVTINYRLDALGFLAHKALIGDDPNYPTSGNYGLLDQRFAMEWIRDNIEAFGGNPNRLTIMGDSSGATSVMYHMVMPKSFGLYSQAIIQSGGGFLPKKKQEGEEIADIFQKKLDCTQTNPSEIIACMREIPWQTIIEVADNTSPATRFQPVIDKYELLDYPFNSFTAGKFNNVPLLGGNVKNEGSLFTSYNKVLTESEYEEWISELAHGNQQLTGLLLQEYKCSDYNVSNCFYAQSDGYGDYSITCPTHIVLTEASKVQENVYGYVFLHRPFSSTYYHVPETVGVGHGDDVPFVFDTLDVNKEFKNNEAMLAEAMAAFWGNFAKCGTPNGCSGEETFEWPLFSTGDRIGLQVDVFSNLEAYKDDKCAFWSKLYPAIQQI